MEDSPLEKNVSFQSCTVHTGGRRKTREKKVRWKVSKESFFLFFFKENELLTSYQSGVISSKDVNFSRQFN